MTTQFTVILSARPRLFYDQALILGIDTVLAKKVPGMMMTPTIERLPADAMAALLSAAYDKTVHPDDPLLATIAKAAEVMLLDRHRAQSLLAGLPEPPPGCAERLAKAERLLKSGVPPADLPRLLKRAALGLSPVPAYAASLTLSDQGVVLGKGTVIVPLDDEPGLALAGNEERILALLSVARWGLATPEMLEKIAGAHRFLARGEVGLAAIHLCLSGQPPLAHRGEAKALDLAARELDQGMRPFDLLKGLWLLPGEVRYAAWRKSFSFNPEQPRDYHGRWTDGSGDDDAKEKPAPSKPTGQKKPTEKTNGTPRKMSEAGLAFLTQREGFSSTVYRDSAGHPTIGYGHKIVAGEDFSGGITESAARELLAQDVTKAEDTVRNSVKVELTQDQFDALVSFTYNVGPVAFSHSTLLRMLNEGK